MESLDILEQKLKNNMEIVESTFKKYKVDLLHIGIECETENTIHILYERNRKKSNYEYIALKCNAYDTNGNLIAVASDTLSVDKYDTDYACLNRRDLCENISKIKVYLTAH